jgi:hypothetical protein
MPVTTVSQGTPYFLPSKKKILKENYKKPFPKSLEPFP